MNNIFITDMFPEWQISESSAPVKAINKILWKLGFRVQLRAPTGRMTNVEQRMNMFHLASQVLVYEVPGDFVGS